MFMEQSGEDGKKEQVIIYLAVQTDINKPEINSGLFNYLTC